jgi:hypothetical protein
MPSLLHEALLLLFRNRPSLAPELLQLALNLDLPAYTEARIHSADLTEVQPAEYRADLVVLLIDDVPVLGIVVEVQLAADERKRYVWPAYAANLRAQLKCPVHVLVVGVNEAVARWASKPIDLGGESRFVPLVLGPSCVPEIADESQARADPELAVLSAIAHGEDADAKKSSAIAAAAHIACLALDEDRSRLYCDLIRNSLSEAAREALRNMDPAKYEFQSDFARKYYYLGKFEARERERDMAARILVKQLHQRFDPVPKEVLMRIALAPTEKLVLALERVLTAPSLDEILGSV